LKKGYFQIFYKKSQNESLLSEADNIKYGFLYLPFIKVIILDNEDFNKFQKIIDLKLNNKNITLTKNEEKIYKKRMQLYAHEYLHFFQALCFKTLQYQSYILQQKLKYEAIIFLKCFEKGIRPIFDFRRDNYSKETGLLELSNKLNDKNLMIQIKKLRKEYKYFIDIWNKTKNGISVLSIIEGMAHIYSLKVNNSNDVLNIEQNKLYTETFKYFLKQFDYKQIDKNWQYILFLYICYFSLSNYSIYNDTNKTRTIDTFIFLSSKIEKLIEYLSEKRQYYSSLPQDQIDNCIKNKILFEHQLGYGTLKQKISLAALFDTILEMEKLASKYKNNSKNEKFLDELTRRYKEISNNIGIDIDNLYLLANLAIYPENFSYLMDLHDKIMNYKDNNLEYDNEQEAEFYLSIIEKCSALMRKDSEIFCCSKHGLITNKQTILECTEDDSFSTLMKNYLEINLKDLFWVR